MSGGEPIRTRILEYIKKEIDRNGYAPTVREICAGVGLRSTSTVHSHLNRLEEMGVIRRNPAKPRALVVMDGSQPRGCSVPLVGKVTAGQPILAVENIEERVMLPDWIGESDGVFCLRVQGESMIEAGILDGDVIVVREQDSAENGEIVVAMIGDEATVKRVYFEPGRVRLQPENRAMQPIYAEHVAIAGRVIGLYRQF